MPEKKSLNDRKSKCLCCAGVFGVGVCMVAMSLALVGIGAAVVTTTDMAGMPGMSKVSSPSLLGVINAYGQPILIASLALFTIAVFLRRSKLGLGLAVIGALMLYASMYIVMSLLYMLAGFGVLVVAMMVTYWLPRSNYKKA